MKFKRNNDYIGPSKGLPKFLHKLFMLVTYPFRKPLIFIPLVIVLYLAPTFMGVKPTEVHLWYWSKVKNVSENVTTVVADKTKDLIPETAKNMIPTVNTSEKGIDQLVDVPKLGAKAVRRQMFEKAKSMPQVVDIMSEKDNTIVPMMNDIGAPEKMIVEQVAKQSDGSKAIVENNSQKVMTVTVPKKLPLVYLDVPKEVKGYAKIINANEIEVGGTYIFLYGIYVNPDSADGLEAKKFLEVTVKNQEVRCSILAYTYQDIATGMCYLGGKNLNQTLVDEELSKNVAL